MIILTTVLLAGCKKEDAGSSSNSYTYENGGKPKTIKIAKVAYSMDGNEMTLLMYASDNENDGIEFYLDSGQDFTVVPEGMFTNNSNPVTFSSAILYYDDGDESYTVKSITRKIIIAKNGDEYKIDFEFTSGAGLVKGSYKGLVARLK